MPGETSPAVEVRCPKATGFFRKAAIFVKFDNLDCESWKFYGKVTLYKRNQMCYIVCICNTLVFVRPTNWLKKRI